MENNTKEGVDVKETSSATQKKSRNTRNSKITTTVKAESKAKTGGRVGRPKGVKSEKKAVAADTSSEKQEGRLHAKSLDQLYSQLTTLLKKNKISKNKLASSVGMSYQGFLNSFKNQNLKLETWMQIGELVSTPFVARFESARQAAAAAASEVAAAATTTVNSVVTHAADEFVRAKLENAEAKVAILERQVASLENQLADKQLIIQLISEKLK